MAIAGGCFCGPSECQKLPLLALQKGIQRCWRGQSQMPGELGGAQV